MLKFLRYLVLVPMLMLMISACTGKRLNQRVTLNRNDKIPYGSFVSCERLGDAFPESVVFVVKDSPMDFLEPGYNESDADDTLQEPTRSLYMAVAPAVIPSQNELDALLNFIRSGNHVFISAAEISAVLLDSLSLKVGVERGYILGDSLQISLQGNEISNAKFTYPGYRWENYLASFDSSITTVLGSTRDSRPNFVRLTYEGGGSILVHLAPLAFSNFFLLHKDNYRYYEEAMSHVPEGVGTVYWDDYFRLHRNGEGGDGANRNTFSKLSVFLKDEILRWPLYLALVLFALIYLFESKRRQRIIPVTPPVKNASLDFVKTIGRLYLQRKDNHDLYSKMVSHFLGHVRSKYTIQTSVLNENFAERLSFRSGYELEGVQKLMATMKDLQRNYEITDDELLNLHRQIEDFYKHT